MSAQQLLAAQRLLQLGQPTRALEVLQQIQPPSLPVLMQLAAVHHALGNVELEVAHLQLALKLQPQWMEGHLSLGSALADRHRYGQAAEAFQQALSLQPLNVNALNNLGTMLKNLHRFPEAIVHLRKAVAFRPDQAEVHNNLGNALLENGDIVEAVAHLQKAVSLRPDFVKFYQGLGHSLVSIGKPQEAINCYRTALKLDPHQNEIHSSLLMSLHYSDQANQDPAGLFHQHQSFNQIQSARIKPISSAHAPPKNRHVRVGYVSADFRRHSVATFFEPLLIHHDKTRFEIFCYSDVPKNDEVTARMQAQASQWRSITGIDDTTVAKMIDTDQIDILIDLSGHTAGGRMMLFARKPAPIQATYLGYPDTTGLSAIDYRITDSIADPPPTADALASEKLLRLPVPFLCFSPPADAPEIAPLPALTTGALTFGSFNTLAKISATTVSLWAAVLLAVPNSTMLIKARGLQHREIADALADQFQTLGITPTRLRFLGHEADTASHLARYQEVDIALDTFPYNGATTSCEALWMGVPVVTLAGQIHVARVGASLLTSLGQTDCIAHTHDEFVSIVQNLTLDLPALANRRSNLRTIMRVSRLTDAPAFAREFEKLLIQMLDHG